MINLTRTADEYLARVAGIDPRVASVLNGVDIRFENLGTTGGDCGGNRIRINPVGTDEHQRETLGHELAHLLDHKLFNGRGHGYGWAYWMRKLGLPIRATHDHEELIRLHKGPIYAVSCFDCGKVGVYTFTPRNCQDRECMSPDVRVDRADGPRME